MKNLNDKTKNKAITTNDTQTKEEITATQMPEDALEDATGGFVLAKPFLTKEDYRDYLKKTGQL